MPGPQSKSVWSNVDQDRKIGHSQAELEGKRLKWVKRQRRGRKGPLGDAYKRFIYMEVLMPLGDGRIIERLLKLPAVDIKSLPDLLKGTRSIWTERIVGNWDVIEPTIGMRNSGIALAHAVERKEQIVRKMGAQGLAEFKMAIEELTSTLGMNGWLTIYHNWNVIGPFVAGSKGILRRDDLVTFIRGLPKVSEIIEGRRKRKK